MVGGYGGDYGGGLVCGRYTTQTEIRMVWTTDDYGHRLQMPRTTLITNWLEMFVLTNYPNARYYGIIGRELNSGFEAVRLWDVEVKLPVNCPILDWSRLPPPGTNSAGIPVGWIVQTAPLYDYGVPMLTPNPQESPNTNIPPLVPGEAEYKLGMRYLNGDGVAKDPAGALDWLVKAAKKGYAGAKEQLRTNALPVFVEWRGSGKAGVLAPAPTPPQTVAAITNQGEPPPQKPPDETPPATNPPPAATPAPKPDEAATLAQLKAANEALEKRVAELQDQIRNPRASDAQPKTNSGSGRWYWVIGILLAISALWFFSGSRREPE